MDGIVGKLEEATIFSLVRRSSQKKMVDEYLDDFTHMSYHSTSESEHAVSFIYKQFLSSLISLAIGIIKHINV